MADNPNDKAAQAAIRLGGAEREKSAAGSTIKRLFDCVAGSALLVTLAPVLGLIGVLIRLDSKGPVLFRQPRHGLHGDVFSIWKFRTMAFSGEGEPFRHVVHDDPGITRIGAVLRQTGLDELPQLFNIVRGEMSFVGPRPHALAHDDEFRDVVEGYSERWNVRPGITGWAQVNGARGLADSRDAMQARIDFDRYYVENWSLLLDLKILMRTVAVVLKAARRAGSNPVDRRSA